MSKYEDSDKQLVEGLKRGEIASFDELFIKYAGKINLLARRYLGSKEDAEELTQEIFIKIWENRNKIKTELSFRSYIFTITYNSIKKFYRDKHFLFEQYIDFLHDSPINTTDSDINYNEIVSQLEIEISKLSSRQKEIFILSREEGLTHKEIAKKLKISTKTVENHLGLATKQIKENLTKAGLLSIIFINLIL